VLTDPRQFAAKKLPRKTENLPQITRIGADISTTGRGTKK
jgi:hypothetical protein